MNRGSSTRPRVRLLPRSCTRVGLPPETKPVDEVRAVQFTQGSPSSRWSAGTELPVHAATVAALNVVGTPAAAQFAARFGLLEMLIVSHGSPSCAKFCVCGENRSLCVGARTEVA